MLQEALSSTPGGESRQDVADANATKAESKRILYKALPLAPESDSRRGAPNGNNLKAEIEAFKTLVDIYLEKKEGHLKVNETHHHAIAELVQLVAVADMNPSSTFLKEVWRPAVTQINASPNRDGSCGGGVRPEETEEVKQFQSTALNPRLLSLAVLRLWQATSCWRCIDREWDRAAFDAPIKATDFGQSVVFCVGCRKAQARLCELAGLDPAVFRTAAKKVEWVMYSLFV
jgi:hypothetical protein